MSSNKRVYPSGAQKRRMKLEAEAAVKKLKPITSFFTPQNQENRDQESGDDDDVHPTEENSLSVNDILQKEPEADKTVPFPSDSDLDTDDDASISIASGSATDTDNISLSSMKLADLVEKKHPSDKGYYKCDLTAEMKRFIISNGPCKPMGPFPRDKKTGNRFSSFFYESTNKAGMKIPRTWLEYLLIQFTCFCYIYVQYIVFNRFFSFYLI